MTLLITFFAATICTAIWYKNAPADNMKISTLCFMYWGAALMWLCDAVAEYIELGAEFFYQKPMEMLNDAFLGLSAVVLGLVIWIISLLIKDPRGIMKKLS